MIRSVVEVIATVAPAAASSLAVANPIPFALDRWFRYGQLTFNPLVLFCLVLMIGAAASGTHAHRSELFWALASTAALVAASIALRAVPGGSFGDRHLLPLLPLIVGGGGLAVATARDDGLFRALMLLSAAIMLPGAIAPWVTPGTTFLAVNMGVTVVAVLGALAVKRAVEGEPAARVWSRVQNLASERRVFAIVAALAIGEVLLYLGTLPTE